VDANGDLVIALETGEVRFRKPLIYQLAADGRREVVDGGFALRALREEPGNSKLETGLRRQARKSKLENRQPAIINPQFEISFQLASYDPARALVIDPFLLYATYLGGNNHDSVNALAVDGSGNFFAAGQTFSDDFPLQGAVDPSFGGTSEGFVTKFTPDGATLIYSTFLGGSGTESVNGLTVDSNGHASVTGATNSTDFPRANAFQNTYGGGSFDAFVAKLLPNGSDLVYSSFLGGSGEDSGRAIAADDSGNAFITGTTSSAEDFPGVASDLQQGFGGGPQDAFVAQVVESGSVVFLAFSDFLGGSGDDRAGGIARDAFGDLYVTGSTDSTDFPTVNPIQPDHAAGFDAFVAKINMDGLFLEYSTYLGGSSGDFGNAIAVDASGNAYMTGQTFSSDFPTVPGSFDTSYNGDSANADAFVTKVDSSGTALVYSTFLGGGGFDQGLAIAVDEAGSAHVAGATTSGVSFPVVSPSQASPGGGDDAFVTKFSPDGAALDFSTLLGGSSHDQALGLALNDVGDVYVGGTTEGDFPITEETAFEPNFGGVRDGFVAILVDAVGPVVNLVPTFVEFPDTLVGATSDPMTVTLSNTGDLSLEITSIAVTSGDFALTHDCGASVEPEASCQIQVTFTPTLAGLQEGAFEIVSNASSNPDVVDLLGEGISTVLVSPTSVHFPGNPLDLDCPSKDVTLTNNGAGLLAILGISIDSSLFSQTNDCPLSLAPGESCLISIKFHPVEVGEFGATLAVTTDVLDSPHTVALSGKGTPPCGLETNGLRRALVKGTNATRFTIADKSPSCSPVPIELSCSLENPAACEFSPSVIAPSGSSDLRVSNLRNVAGDRLNFTVQAVSEFRTAAVAVSVIFSSFDFSAFPQSATVAAGGTAEYAVSLRPVNGLTGTVRLSCSGAPRGATCTVEPSQVTLDGLNLANVKVRVRTTGRAMTTPPGGGPIVPPIRLPWLATSALLLGLVAAWTALRRRQARLALASVLAAVLLWAACGGGGALNLSSGGTPPGTSSLTVTGSYTIAPDEANPEGGTFESSTELSLTVN
jgi:hypothetical protein